jgi:rhomboid protease GluP
MPAILCPRCHKIVSPDAETCPHCGQRKPGLWGATATMRKLGLQLDFPHLITVVCGALYLLMLALDPGAIFESRDMMRILSPSNIASLKAGATGMIPIYQYDLWWTPITAIYLHGGLLHIFFNMMWVRQLGPIVEDLFGPFRLFAIFTVAGITGFLLSTLVGHAITLGASGSIFGLLAAAIAYGRRTGAQLFTRQFLQWAVLLFIMGFVFPGVDNWAHGGGFIGGYAVAYVFSRSQEREGISAYLIGGLCLLATVGAFALQFIAILGMR